MRTSHQNITANFITKLMANLSRLIGRDQAPQVRSGPSGHFSIAQVRVGFFEPLVFGDLDYCCQYDQCSSGFETGEGWDRFTALLDWYHELDAD